MTVKVIGLDRLEIELKKLSNPARQLDPIVKEQSILMLNKLTNKTPLDTGRTRRAWARPRKLADSEYVITNTMQTQDKKHAVVDILNDGRGTVTPKKAKKLYIPISKRAKYKKLGAHIPKNWKWGKDFVLASKSRAVKGTKYVDNIVREGTAELVKAVLSGLKGLI